MKQAIIDNRSSEILGEVLKHNLERGGSLSLITAYFTIYAFHALKKELAGLDEVKILFSEPVFEEQIGNLGNINPTAILGDAGEFGLKSKLDLQRIAKECASWVKNKTKIRSAVRSGIVGTKMIVVDNPGEEDVAFNTSSSNFNSVGLGYAPTEEMVMNTMTTEPEVTRDMLQFFQSIWNDPAKVGDIKHKVLKQLEFGFKDQSPDFLYFFTLYNIFKEYLEDLDEEKIVKSRTGFKNSVVWNKLYKFQQDGVLGAIDKIEKYNGCVIADSVGLGKTFEALAVIKYYELRNDRVLVLCPKKLRDNWTMYKLNDTRNILIGDRFNYDVLNHTDLSRDRGYTGEINLETVNWGNYDMIVIDESHNFRNSNPTKQRETRYSRLMNRIIRSGVRTKVLMLSATPVNNRMNDLKNQVAFITEGDDFAFEEFGVNSIGEVMKRAQTQFNNWLKNTQDKNVDHLLEILDGRYFKLLDLITIARSRKHIEKYYNINDIGQFPNRLPPKNIKSDIDLEGRFPALKQVNREIRKLNLSSYSPLKYVRSDKQAEYSAKYDLQLSEGRSFRQVDREESLIHLMRVNMLKRMESSIHSFGLTVERILKSVDLLLDKILNQSDYIDEDLNIEDVDIEDPQLSDFLIGNKVKVLLQDMDLVRWKQDLLEDRERLQQMKQDAKAVGVQRDAKLKDLENLIVEKVKKPINAGNQKIIIFTAFADTAKYLYEHLAPWAHQALGLHSALVTGTGKNDTNLPGIRKDLTDLLINFSPLSKERDKIQSKQKAEIDLLIATDCISEGQNLQDCDFLVNYDIHWNPVRIIQRFGRIDRLGSVNEQIQLVNFWPNMELDEYIDLEARVSGRMVLLDISATGEENVIDQRKDMNDLDYRRRQLEQLQNQVIDLEDMQGGISITDLTFNDFKMELMDYLKDHREALESTPTGIYSVVDTDYEEAPNGVIFCLRQLHPGKDDRLEYNPISPYFLVYLDESGEVVFSFTQSKKVLDHYQRLCAGKSEVMEDLVNAFKTETQDLKNMDAYTSLLEKAAEHIKGKSEEKGTVSLFSAGGTAGMKEVIRSLEDFELISYLIIKKGDGH